MTLHQPSISLPLLLWYFVVDSIVERFMVSLRSIDIPIILELKKVVRDDSDRQLYEGYGCE
jgi:hypothetical protein